MGGEQERIAHLDTPALNAYRRSIAEAIAELKNAEKNLKTLANQNLLDITPTLLSEADTSGQERRHAADAVLHSLAATRLIVDTLPK